MIFAREERRVNGILDDLDRSLDEAWNATETHRAALAEQAETLVPRVREKWNGKRLLIVGGRRAPWWDDLRADAGLSEKTAWVQSEPGSRPSMEKLKAVVAGGKLDAVVILIDYIAHATSEIRRFAEDRKVPVVDAATGRFSMLTALDRA